MSGAQYAALLGLWVAGIVIPGPDIFLILRNAFLSTRRNALFTALGIMVGNATWITLSLMGVTVLISGNHVLKLVVQIAGALFLARMGYSSLRGYAGLVRARVRHVHDDPARMLVARVVRGLDRHLRVSRLGEDHQGEDAPESDHAVLVPQLVELLLDLRCGGVLHLNDHGRLQTRPSRAINSWADSGPHEPGAYGSGCTWCSDQ